jgi:hypothetical protein
MMIRRCRNCDRFYWRWRRDHPPPRYCSIPCADHIEPAADTKESPHAVLLMMHAHRLRAHRTASVIDWFDDCETCARLEGRYAEALTGVEPERPAKTKGASA